MMIRKSHYITRRCFFALTKYVSVHKIYSRTFPLQSYRDTVNRVNVKIGKKNGFKEFFNMQHYNYRSFVPGYDATREDCNASIEGKCKT